MEKAITEPDQVMRTTSVTPKNSNTMRENTMTRILQPTGSANQFRLTPLLAALLLVYPAMQSRPAQAQGSPTSTLPDLGSPNERPGSISPRPNGVTLDNSFDGKRLVVSPEYSDQTGASLGGIFAFPMGDSAAGGLLVTAGGRKKELLFNAGFQLGDVRRLVFTLGQQRQTLDFGFVSGNEKTELAQNSGAVSYQHYLGNGALNSFEVNGYLTNTPSRDLADKTYATDTATLYELWNDHRRVAGGRVSGLQGRLGFTPAPGGSLKLGVGGERQEYDYLTGKQSTTRGTGSAEWTQYLTNGYQIKAAADAAIQNRYTFGLERPFGDGLLGIDLVAIRSKDGAPNDNQIKLVWSVAVGGRRAPSGNTNNSAVPTWGNLLDQVSQHPSFLPAQVVARVDTTALPVRLIAVNKTALPAGSSVNTSTGAVTAPVGRAITSIAGVTKNGAPFANAGQFTLSGNNLSTDPNKIIQPAVGVIDTYVVTLNNAAGGTTLVTVVVSHGSVKIDSITVAAGDMIGPVTTAAPAVSGTTGTATTLSVTINENGTGYYLVLPTTAAAPSVAAVQAGTSFAMSANVPASVNIGGLASFTAYRIYFVAKDAENNVQAEVQSVAVTSADITPPLAVADNATTFSNTAKTGIDVLANDTDNSGVAPTLTGVLSNPVGGTFAVNAGKIDFTPTPGFVGAASVKYEIKDGSNNKATGILTVTVVADAIAPVAVADSASTPFNTAKTGIDVLANDTDNSGAAPTLTGVLSNPVGGTFVVNAGKIDFTPTLGFAGAASVSYEIKDGSNNKATGTLTVTVGGDSTAPVAMPDSASTPFNTAKTGIDVLANDTNSGGIAPTLTGVLTNPVGGTFVVNAGKIDFTPAQGFSGAASVTYEIVDADGSNRKATATLTVTVGTDPAAPVAAPDSVATPYNTAKTGIDVLANDTDSSGIAPALTGVLTNPVGGTFVVRAGKIDFTPSNGFSGAASVTYEIVDMDGSNNKATGVLTVTVAAYVPPPTAPTASSVSISGTAQAGQVLTGSYTYADANGDPQGVSTFRWLRGGVAIAGATASTYTLVAADAGSTITFEVTPVATVAPTTGTPVVSAATAAVTLPAGYVSQGGLTWMPVSVTLYNFAQATTLCAGTFLGQTGWRLPTFAELNGLFVSGAMNGQGWKLGVTSSSTPNGVGWHFAFDLSNGSTGWYADAGGNYVTCVR